MKTKDNPTHHTQIAIKDFWPMPEEPFEADYLKYIHRVLQEKIWEGISNLPPSTTFPLPITDELVTCADPHSGGEVVESTLLRCRIHVSCINNNFLHSIFNSSKRYLSSLDIFGLTLNFISYLCIF